MKTVTIEIPDDCEVKIVKKEEKKEPVIKTYQDLINKSMPIEGHQICANCTISPKTAHIASLFYRDCAASEKVAKSMLAMAMISQLMPYYGGEVTDEEWYNINLLKYCITCRNNKVYKEGLGQLRVFLAFHTAEQRDEFLKWNLDLVKDYLMIND